MNTISRLTVVAALTALPAVAFAQHDHSNGPDRAANMTEADKAMMEAHMKMMKNMDMKPTGDPDKDFVTMMIPHHQSAVDMARVQLTYGKDPELRALAEKIIADQEKEIAQMQAWRERQ